MYSYHGLLTVVVLAFGGPGGPRWWRPLPLPAAATRWWPRICNFKPLPQITRRKKRRNEGKREREKKKSGFLLLLLLCLGSSHGVVVVVYAQSSRMALVGLARACVCWRRRVLSQIALEKKRKKKRRVKEEWIGARPFTLLARRLTRSQTIWREGGRAST